MSSWITGFLVGSMLVPLAWAQGGGGNQYEVINITSWTRGNESTYYLDLSDGSQISLKDREGDDGSPSSTDDEPYNLDNVDDIETETLDDLVIDFATGKLESAYLIIDEHGDFKGLNGGREARVASSSSNGASVRQTKNE